MSSKIIYYVDYDKVFLVTNNCGTERREEISESTAKSLISTGQYLVVTVELEQENE